MRPNIYSKTKSELFIYVDKVTSQVNRNSGLGYLSQVFILLFGLFLCGLITGCVLLSDEKFYEEPRVPNSVKSLGDRIKGKLSTVMAQKWSTYGFQGRFKTLTKTYSETIDRIQPV